MPTTKTLDTRIRFKIDLDENWTSNNPVLLEGEMAIVTYLDSNRVGLKFGDGSTPYNQLAFFNPADTDYLETLIDNKIILSATQPSNQIVGDLWLKSK